MGSNADPATRSLGERPYRRLKIYIDGAEVAGLRPDETFTAEVAEGLHKIRGRMGIATGKPLSVDVTGDELISVKVSLPFLAVFKGFIVPWRAVQARQL